MPLFVTGGAASVRATLFVLAFLLVGLGIGFRLLRLLRVPEDRFVAERTVIAVMLGAGTLQLVPFLLGVTSSLSARSLGTALAVVAACTLPDAWRAARAWKRATTGTAPERWLLAWLLALLPGLLVALLLAWTPTLDPDGLGYHLTVPKRWLLQGSLGYLPTYPYSNSPMGVEMLFMSALALAGDTAAKLQHFALGLVGASTLFLAGRRLGGSIIGAVAVTSFLLAPIGVGAYLGWAYLEGATSAALAAAGLAWLIWFQERDRAWLRCAVALAGIGVSFKMTAGLFPVALAALTLLILGREARSAGRPVVREVVSVARLLPLLLLPVLPWLVRSAVVTGNPVFPMAAQWIPSRDLSSHLAAQFDQYNRYLTWGVGLSPEWTLARRKLLFDVVALGILCTGLFVTLKQRTFVGRATAAVVLATVLVQVGVAGLYKRYSIPVFSVFQLPLLVLFARTLSARWVRSALVTATALLSLLQARQLLKGVNNDVSGLLRTAFGQEDQLAFMRKHVLLLPIYERANHEAGANAGVMLAQYCGGFYLDPRTFCADIVQEALRFDNWPSFLDDLRRLHITYAVAPRAWAEIGSEPLMEGGNVSMLVRQAEHHAIGRLIREHGELRESAGDQGLYALDLPAAE